MPTVNNFTLTQNATTGNWELTCLNDNFNAQEKKVKLNCKDRNMTGDLIVDVKAKTGSAKVNDTSQAISPSIDYTNKRAQISSTSFSVTGTASTAGWITSVSSGTVTILPATTSINTTTKYISPSKNQITVSRDSNNFLDSVVVYGVPDTKIRRCVDTFEKVTSPIDTSTSGSIGDNLNIGYVYSYQMIQSLKSESTGQYCRFYAKGFTSVGSSAHSVTYNGSAGYWIGNVDDGDVLMCKYSYQSGSTYYWNWYILRTGGDQELFGTSTSTDPSYGYIYDVRLDKQNDASEKVVRVNLVGTFTS